MYITTDRSGRRGSPAIVKIYMKVVQFDTNCILWVGNPRVPVLPESGTWKTGRWAKYCDKRVCLSACMFVCLFVYLSARISPNLYVACSNYTTVLHMLPAVVVWSSSAISYVLPVLLMTSRFHIIEPLDQNQALRYVLSSSLDGGNGGEVTIFDCRLVTTIYINIYM